MPRLVVLLAAVALAAVALAAACSPDRVIRPRQAALTPDVDTLPVGARVRLVLTALDGEDTPANGYVVQWSTSAAPVVAFTADTADASDDASNPGTDAARSEVADAEAPRVTIVAHAPGTATIRAVVGGLEAHAAIVVVPASQAPLRLAPDSTVLPVGDELAFAARARGASRALDGAALAWASSDTTVATVSPAGRVRAHGSGVAVVTARAGGDVASATVRVRAPLADVTAPAALDFATYDGSREVAHPDVVFFPDGWHGRRYWTAITPYPGGNAMVENPSVFAGDDGEGFVVPAGVTNPLAHTSRGHLSDPDLVYDASLGELRLYYREAVYEKRSGTIVFGSATHQGDEIWLTTSGDGVHWSPPARLLSSDGAYFVSPSVVRGGRDRQWRLWGVDAGAGGCDSFRSTVTLRESGDGVRWGRADAVALAQPGYVPWHLDVAWVAARREYWALVAAYPTGTSCSRTDLFLATSPDGRTWTTYPSPLLARGTVPQFADLVYRSALDASGDVATVWLSGARAEWTDTVPRMRWSAAVARTSLDALLDRVRRARRASDVPNAVPLAARHRLDAAMP